MTSSAHLQVPEHPSMKQNQPAGSTWSNQEISIPFNLRKKSNPQNVLVSCVIMLCHWIQTRRVTRSMKLCKLFHFTPCWTQNGEGWGEVCIGERSSVIQCDSYQHPLASERTGLCRAAEPQLMADYDRKQVRRWLTVKQNIVSKEHGADKQPPKKATPLSLRQTFNLAVLAQKGFTVCSLITEIPSTQSF